MIFKGLQSYDENYFDSSQDVNDIKTTFNLKFISFQFRVDWQPDIFKHKINQKLCDHLKSQIKSNRKNTQTKIII